MVLWPHKLHLLQAWSSNWPCCDKMTLKHRGRGESEWHRITFRAMHYLDWGLWGVCMCVWMDLCVLVDLLDSLDPDAVVCDVQIVQYVCRLVLSEDFMNIQQAFEDAGFPWARQHSGGRQMEKQCYSCSLLRMTMHSSCWQIQHVS